MQRHTGRTHRPDDPRQTGTRRQRPGRRQRNTADGNDRFGVTKIRRPRRQPRDAGLGILTDVNPEGSNDFGNSLCWFCRKRFLSYMRSFWHPCAFHYAFANESPPVQLGSPQQIDFDLNPICSKSPDWADHSAQIRVRGINSRSTCWLQSKNFPQNLHGLNVLLFDNMRDNDILKHNSKTTGEADGVL